MAANPFQQLQLDLGAAMETRPEHPGDMGYEEWHARQDVAFHGTFSENWEDANATHFGSREAAEQLLRHNNASFSSPLDHTRSQQRNVYTKTGAELGDGVVHARRLENVVGPSQVAPGRVSRTEGAGRLDNPHAKGARPPRATGDAPPNPYNLFADDAANLAHAVVDAENYSTSSGTVTDSIAGTDFGELDADDLYDAYEGGEFSREEQEATDALREGHPIPYLNYVEGPTGISHVAKDVGDNPNVRSYAQDVLDSPNRSHLSKQFADLIPATEPAASAETYHIGWQPTLGGKAFGSVSGHRVFDTRTVQSYPKPPED